MQVHCELDAVGVAVFEVVHDKLVVDAEVLNALLVVRAAEGGDERVVQNFRQTRAEFVVRRAGDGDVKETVALGVVLVLELVLLVMLDFAAEVKNGASPRRLRGWRRNRPSAARASGAARRGRAA